MIAAVAPSLVTLFDGQHSVGSGFVVAPGRVATNVHLLVSPTLWMVTAQGERHRVRVVARDPVRDLALIQISGTDPRALPLRRDPVRVGETVIALGNPFGLGITATRGIISAQGDSIGKDERLQTDAAINPGNSGGPLIDTRGRVVGIVNARSTVGQGVGFVVPAAALAELLKTAAQNEGG